MSLVSLFVNCSSAAIFVPLTYLHLVLGSSSTKGPHSQILVPLQFSYSFLVPLLVLLGPLILVPLGPLILVLLGPLILVLLGPFCT